MNDWAASAVNPGVRTSGVQLGWPSALGSPFAIALVAYLVLALILLPNYMMFHYKDEITYLAAAERYARGDFAIAPNSQWGPLISWLMALPLSIGLSPIVAARAVHIVLGAVALWSVRSLAKTMGLPPRLQLAFLLTLVPHCAYFAILTISADLPLTAALVFYFAIICDPKYPSRRYSGILCGILGGFAYYAKGYALPFFLLHFVLCNALHWLSHAQGELRRKVVRHLTAGLAVFAALVAIWSAALYQKYGVVTVGIAGSYNYQIAGPDAKSRPSLSMGFAEPPPSTTVSIWEDSAYFYALPEARDCCLKSWSPFDSPRALMHQFRKIQGNLGRTLLALISFSPFSLGVCFAVLAYAFAPWWPSNRRPTAPLDGAPWTERGMTYLADIRELMMKKQRLMPLLMLLTIIVYAVPYMLIWSDGRYLWPVLVLVMGLGFFLLNAFFTTYNIRRTTSLWLIGIFAISFVPLPTYKLSQGHKARAATNSFVRQLEGSEFAGARFASNIDYGASMVVGYYLKAKYYGQAIPGMSEADILASLKSKNVQYYFVWGAPPTPRPGMTLSRVLKGEFRSLAIYKIDP